MTAVTIRRIVQEIRHQRELLTAEERWAQQQEPSAQRAETYRRIRYWREVYADAEAKLGQQ
jgi:hypothetical protein